RDRQRRWRDRVVLRMGAGLQLILLDRGGDQPAPRPDPHRCLRAHLGHAPGTPGEPAHGGLHRGLSSRSGRARTARSLSLIHPAVLACKQASLPVPWTFPGLHKTATHTAISHALTVLLAKEAFHSRDADRRAGAFGSRGADPRCT